MTSHDQPLNCVHNVDISQPCEGCEALNYELVGEAFNQAAEDFYAAAALLNDVNAPADVVADVSSEAIYLAHANPAEIGAPDVALRYVECSRTSRRMIVRDWLRSIGLRQPGATVQRALNIIGGEGF